MLVEKESTYLPPHVYKWRDRRLWHLGAASWSLIEAVIAAMSMYLGFRLTPARPANFGPTHVGLAHGLVVYVPMLVMAVHATGLHNNLNLIAGRWRIIVLTLVGVTTAIAVTTFIISFVFFEQIGRHILLICGTSSFLLGIGLRITERQYRQGATHRIAMLGSAQFCALIEAKTKENAGWIEVAHSIAEDVHEIVVETTLRNDSDEISVCLDHANHGVQVSTAAAFIERNFYCIPCTIITAEWIFSIDFRRRHPFYNDLKRVCDIVMSIVSLVLSVPLLCLAALIIKLEDGGPVFYSQTRVGQFQKEFSIYKLRTMRVNAEQGIAMWAMRRDSRVTRIGRFLRTCRVDEIPQFWNILQGDMTFIGPRPERPEFVERLAASIPFYKQRHLVKPGLTGWAQICYPYGASEEDAREKLSYDFYYIKNSSLLLDFQIILQTVGAIAKGAR